MISTQINSSSLQAIQQNLGNFASQNQFKGMRFCKECDNMLYPKEQTYDENQGISRLIYDCRICGHFEKAREGDEWENCVYKSDNVASGAQMNNIRLAIDKDCIKDPTLQRVQGIKCVNKQCKGTTAVTFTQPTKDRLSLVYVCVSCAAHWRKEQDENSRKSNLPTHDSDMSD